jgi:hypothetical protein
MDLDIRDYLSYLSGHHLMALRCDVTIPTGSASVNIYTDESQPYLNMAYQYMVELTSTDPSRVVNGILYGVMAKSAILGCTFNVSGQHVIRLINSYGVQISHNALQRPLATKHCLKMHANLSGSNPTVWDESSSTTNLATSYNVVSHNIGGTVDSEQTWTFTADPQNASGTQPEGITDVIFESNQFHDNGNVSRKDITRGGRRITNRGNTNIDASFIEDSNENSPNIPTTPSDWRGPYFSS